MKRLNSHNRIQSPTPAARRGVTLTEVLMSLMIMSIGISAVAVLFPISMLRSIQATQLTNGAIVKYNVETLIDMFPRLVFDPDGDGNLVEHVQRQNQRNYIVDPVGFYTHFQDGSGFHNWFGNDGASAATFTPRFGGGLVALDGGNHNASAAHARAIRLLAQSIAGQGDGWTTQIDTQAVSLVSTGSEVVGMTLSTDLDLTQIPTSDLLLPPDGGGGYLIPDPELYRIVMFSLDGKISQSFPLTYVDTASNTVYWSEDTDADGTANSDYNMNGFGDIRALPNQFRVDVNGNGSLEFGEERVGRVLLQSSRIADFSWMLNVRRRSDGMARSIDVIVRFNDGVDAADEQLFEATFLPSTIGAASNQIGVRITGGVEPSIRKGKFVFDAINGIWYRVQDVQEKPLLAAGALWANYDYLVTVETDIAIGEGAGSDADNGSLDGSDTSSWGAAMFPAGIVDIYPMGSRQIPEELQ